MKKLLLALGLCLTTMTASLTSCGSGVDRKDPQSVADAALKYYDAQDYEGLKTLVNPANTSRINDIDNTIKLVERLKAENPEKAAESKENVVRTFKYAKEEFTGNEITPDTKSARVYYDAESYPRVVVVEQIDGKWYFECFK